MVCFGSRDASAAIVDVDGLYGRRTDGGLLPTVRPRRLHFHDEQVWDAECGGSVNTNTRLEQNKIHVSRTTIRVLFICI